MKNFQKPSLILLFIILIGFFFRIYKLEIFFPFGHDQDLFAMIAKDIAVDHHIRLIGQQTTLIGVFIGPLFYYLMALFFSIFNMDPLSSAIPITIIAVLTIISIYWVFNKFFGSRIGLIGAFLYAISPGIVFFSRWGVPTQPTTLWSVWYLFALFSILKKRIPFALLAITVGLVWHIHIALIPLLLLIPLSFWLSSRQGEKIKIQKRSLLISLLIFFVLMLPFFVFEVRHGFQQIRALTNATYHETGEIGGFDRLTKSINLGGRSLAAAFLLSNPTTDLDPSLTMVLPFLLIGVIYYLFSKKDLTKSQIAILIFWIAIVFAGQFFSKQQISEHYFNVNWIILFLAIALILNRLQDIFSKLPVTFFLLILYLGGVLIWLINKPNDFGGYIYKKQVIEYIKNDSLRNDYSCVAINFIEDNIDKGNGFRYLSWFYNLKVIRGGNDIPVYNIVTPWTISSNEINAKFGIFGVILPEKKKINLNICSDPNRQLLPLLGFTK